MPLGQIPQVEGLNPSETGFLISKIGCVIIRAGLCDVPDTQVFKNWQASSLRKLDGLTDTLERSANLLTGSSC